MGAAFARLLLLAALLAGLPLQARAEERAALVIGNGAYANVPTLRNAVGDARAMRRQLAAVGFTVVYREDATRRAMNQAVDEFVGLLSSSSVGLVYYAGHGVQVGTTNYLIPTDIQVQSANDVANDGIDLSRVLERMTATQARFSLAIIDACRDNPFRVSGRTLGASRGLAPTTTADGVMVVYSAGANQTALDSLSPADPSPNGLFTREWLRVMAIPGLPIQAAATQVRLAVAAQARAVGHAQVPALYDQSTGSFEFIPGPSAAAAPAQPPAVVPPPLPLPAPLPAPAPAVASAVPPRPAAPLPDPAGERFERLPCGAILDRATRLEWYVGPDVTMGRAEAEDWVQQLRACGGKWWLPTVPRLQGLFDPRFEAGSGFVSGGRRWPAHLHPAFAGIGGGSWVWAAGAAAANGAPAFNFNQGMRVVLPPGSEFTVRAFAVRPGG